MKTQLGYWKTILKKLSFRSVWDKLGLGDLRRVQIQKPPQQDLALYVETLESRQMLSAAIAVIGPNPVAGTEGQTAMAILRLARPATRPFVVNVVPSGGTATPDEDYTYNARILFRPGERTKSFAIQLIKDNQQEPTETYQLSFRSSSHFVRFRPGRDKISGSILDRTEVVSVSAQDSTVSEVPPFNRDYDEGIFRFSRNDSGRSTTVYFVARDLNGPLPTERVVSNADWAAKVSRTERYPNERVRQGLYRVGYKKYQDPENPGQFLKTPVYGVTIPRGQSHVDVTIQARNDTDYELDETLTFHIVDEFEYDRSGQSKTQKANYQIGNEKANMTIVDKTADIDIAAVPDNEDDEDNPGADIFLNDDDDNDDGVPDLNKKGLHEDCLFQDDDLISVSIKSLIPEDLDFESDYFTLSFSRDIRLWWNQDKSVGPDGKAQITTATIFDEAAAPFHFWVEGVGIGSGKVDLIWHEFSEPRERAAGRREPKTHVFDSFKYSVWGVDVDIDSDNNNVLGRSDWEDQLENNKYGLGKLLLPIEEGETGSAPITIELPKGLASQEKIWLSGIDSSGALFTRVANDAPNFANAARYQDGAYSLFSLGYNNTTGLIRLYVTGRDSSHMPYKTLKELERQGSYASDFKVTYQTPSGVSVSDEVKYLVADKPSIFWEIQEKPQVRAALASTAVYDLKDLPHAALEILDRSKEDKLRKLSVSDEVIRWLNRLDGDPSQLPNGFTATVYRNYTSGPSSYLIAFCGDEF